MSVSSRISSASSVNLSILSFAAQALMGSFFIAALSQVSLPFYPVPATLQPLAVLMIALHMKPSKAFAATLLYLVECSIGLPFLAGGVVKTFWLGSYTAGYLVAYPIIAFVCSYIYNLRKPTFSWGIATLLIGQAILFTFGVTWLSFYVGVSKAIAFGFIPFILSGVAKVVFAASSRTLSSYFHD